MAHPVLTSVLTGAHLQRRVLSRYDLPKPVNCHRWAGGLNDTYKVTAGPRTHYLRLYHAHWRRRGDVEAEADMLAYLARRAHPVAGPIPRRDGRYVTGVDAPEGRRYAVLFTEARGEPPRFGHYTLDLCRRYGRIAGDMHVALDRRPMDRRRFHLDLRHLLDQPLAHLAPVLAHRPDHWDALQRVADGLRAGVESLLPTTRPEYGCCHGDHHGYNLHLDADGGLTVLDFDCYGYGWRAYDVAVFLWQHRHEGGWERAGRARTGRRWHAFLEGYTQARPLSDDELEATRLFVPIRQIWWMGLHAYHRKAEIWGGALSDGFLDHHLDYIRRSVRADRLL